MDCKTVMAPIRTCLYAEDTAGSAINFMIEKHMGLVPVTDRLGRFVGLISGDQLMGYLLPRTTSAMASNKRGMKEASHFSESAEVMNGRLTTLRNIKIGDLVDRDTRLAYPNTPLIDALMMIQQKQFVVPVVNENNILLGAISSFSVFNALQEEYDRESVEALRPKEREKRKKT